MIKNLLSATFLFLALNTFSQSFSGMYPFTGVASGSASTGTTDPTPPPTATGLTFGAFTAVGTATSPAAGGAFAFSGWDATITNGNDAYTSYTGAVNPAKYYEVTLSPTAGYSVTLNSITFNVARSSTGPRNWAVRSNKDTYTGNLPASVTSNSNINVQTGDVFFWALDSYTVVSGKQERGSTINLGGANFTDQTTPYTFRFYIFNSESGAGTFRIDTVKFNGIVNNASGIHEYSQDINSAFKIYPNPSNDGIVFIDTKKINFTNIEVVNLLGTVVSTAKNENSPYEKTKLDLNTLPSGTYFIRITANNKVYTERFFITR